MSINLDPSSAALGLARQFEGCLLTAYQDAVGVWTIGYGHTGPDVHAGLVWTQDQADITLAADMANAGAQVCQAVVTSLNQNQFDALCDFTFNLGPGRLARSTLLRLVNQGSYGLAANEFGKWVLAGGKPLPGLVRRRAAERALFEKPC